MLTIMRITLPPTLVESVPESPLLSAEVVAGPSVTPMMRMIVMPVTPPDTRTSSRADADAKTPDERVEATEVAAAASETVISAVMVTEPADRKRFTLATITPAHPAINCRIISRRDPV
jgi:hypothetical protein